MAAAPQAAHASPEDLQNAHWQASILETSIRQGPSTTAEGGWVGKLQGVKNDGPLAGSYKQQEFHPTAQHVQQVGGSMPTERDPHARLEAHAHLLDGDSVAAALVEIRQHAAEALAGCASGRMAAATLLAIVHGYCP